ncbi:hypothetical protein CK1_20780 [Ruminococcus sp. SR1/5]|nr:hypothetical protein CK1_20780 [Ruminococcus sp. SR1/5]
MFRGFFLHKINIGNTWMMIFLKEKERVDGP